MINYIFFAIFSTEMIVKILGVGPKNYFKDNFNRFDVIVILLSMSDIILSDLNIPDVGRTLVIFRSLRFLRIFKLARRWKSF